MEHSDGSSLAKTPRLVHIDALRILAIFFVMFIHTNEKGMHYYPYEANGTLRWLYLAFSQCATIAVPLFFMISGATLLGKTESKRVVWKKRILRIFLVLVSISVIYGVYHVVLHDWTLTFANYFQMIYSHGMFVHLWYLYSYLAFLMMLPLLRKMVQHMKNSDFLYFGILALVLTNIIPALEYFIGHSNYPIQSDIKGALFLTSNILYPVMGYYIEHVMPKACRTWKMAVIGILLSALSVCTGAYLTLAEAGYSGASADDVQNYFTSLTLMPAWTVYFCVKLLFDSIQVPKALSQLLTTMGSAVFGVYLFDQILREQTMFVYDFLINYVPSPIACIGWLLFALVLGIGAVALLKKIPVIRLLF